MQRKKHTIKRKNKIEDHKNLLEYITLHCVLKE